MLEKIMAVRRKQLEKDKRSASMTVLLELIDRSAPAVSLSRAMSESGIGLIAEIKGSSPSQGLIREKIDPKEIALIYQNNGAAAISVLTEKHFFSGDINYLQFVREVTDLPILRKDFIFDEFQLFEARAYGADAVLLMNEVVTDENELERLIDAAHRLGLEVLLESSNKDDLELSLKTNADVIGINNRDFDTLKVDIDNGIELMSKVSVDRPAISESGIFTRDDVQKMERAGFNGILVGTSLMKSKDIGKKIEELMRRD